MSFDSTSSPQYSEFIALSRYARWLPEESRRETWENTVDRYCDFMLAQVKSQLSKQDYEELESLFNDD